MSVTRLRAEDRRSIILRVLYDQAGFSLNEHVLQDALGSFGHNVAGGIVRDDLQWLAERDLVSVERASMWLATLTRRGADVAQDRERVPGIKRALPDERGAPQ